MLFDTKSNIYNQDGYLTDGILVENHYNFNDNIPAIAVQYRNNQMNGFYKTFSETGQLISNRTFCDGLLHGISKFYDENGSLIVEDEYDYGMKIKSTKYTPVEPQEVSYTFVKRPHRHHSLSELEG